jgi:hypothetical protein
MGAPPSVWRRVARAAAGPVLIVLAVLVVLHDFAFGGWVSAQHPDLLAYWLPTHCYLGESLAGGEIPTWNRHVMGGVPFAADPQSGWMYLPAMVLYTALPCATALTWFITLQPIVAGLGAYAFLRSEDLSRPAATSGGLVLALAIAGSWITLALPFAGAIAWTAVLLAAASRYIRAPSWSSRLPWLLLTALAWGQVAAAHLSHGLALGTGVLAAYIAARSISEVRAGRRSRRDVLSASLLLLAALPLVNLAYLLPRISYLPRTSLALGYEGLPEAAAAVGGVARAALPGPGGDASWPLHLATWPGAYLGAAALALSFAWWRSRGRRIIPTALAVFAGVCYILSLEAVGEALTPFALEIPFGSMYAHAPWRLGLGVVLIVPLLAAFGIDAWRSAADARERVLMIAPGVLLWWILTAVVAEPARLLLLVAGAAAGAAALWLAARRRALFWAVPGVLAVELAVGALAGQGIPRHVAADAAYPPGKLRALTPLLEPEWSAASYAGSGPIVVALPPADSGRFLSEDPRNVDPNGTGYLGAQRPRHWGLLANQRAMLFGQEDVLGYNPFQLRRYWSFVRAVGNRPIGYHTTLLVDPPPAVLDLLHVETLLGPAADLRSRGLSVVAESSGWGVARLPGTAERATVHASWSVAGSMVEALELVLEPGFDPSEELILESEPGLTSSPRGPLPARARFRWTGTGSAEIEVDSAAGGLLLVRNAFDPGWEAAVDGRPAKLLVADFLMQAVPIPAGRHTVELIYRDRSVGYGLVGSAVTIAAVVGAGVALRVRRRRDGGARPR